MKKLDEIMGIKIHPAANAFPLLTGKDFNDLVKSIEKDGMRTPVMVLYPPHIKKHPLLIVDGRNRLRAWEKLYKAGKVEKDAWLEEAYYASELCNASDDLAIKQLVYDLNVHRRHLTADMRSMAVELLFGDEIRNGNKGKAGRPSKKMTQKPESIIRDRKKSNANSSAGQLAAKAGTTRHSVARAAKIRAAEGKHPAVPKGTSQKIANGEVDAKEIEKMLRTAATEVLADSKPANPQSKKTSRPRPVAKGSGPRFPVSKRRLREDLFDLIADWQNAEHSVMELKELLLELAGRLDG